MADDINAVRNRNDLAGDNTLVGICADGCVVIKSSGVGRLSPVSCLRNTIVTDKLISLRRCTPHRDGTEDIATMKTGNQPQDAATNHMLTQRD